jgi:hypothetical protein
MNGQNMQHDQRIDKYLQQFLRENTAMKKWVYI